MVSTGDGNFILCSNFSSVFEKLISKKILALSAYNSVAVINGIEERKISNMPDRMQHDIKSLTSISKSLDIIDLDKKEREHVLRDRILQKDMLFFGGGNTFTLMDAIDKSGFRNIFTEFMQNGGICIGSSAGSCVLGTSIEYTKFADEPDRVSTSDTLGLGILPFRILPHFNQENFYNRGKDMISYHTQNKKTDIDPLIMLTDAQAILFDSHTGSLSFVK